MRLRIQLEESLAMTDSKGQHMRIIRCNQCGSEQAEDFNIEWREIRYISPLMKDETDNLDKSFCSWLCIERYAGKKAAQEVRN